MAYLHINMREAEKPEFNTSEFVYSWLIKMKRVVRSKSGSEIYGSKRLNNHIVESDALRSLNSVQTTELAPVFHAAIEPPPVTHTNVVANHDQTNEGINGRRIRLSNRHETMYRATLEGDCVAAEMLLEGDPNLGSDEITEEGDRALHVAASMKHRELVQILVEIMSESDLTLLDGHGYTACCYAAISGAVKIATIMIRKNPTLASARDRENKTPLFKAALHGHVEMVSYFLKYAEIDGLSTEEWFDLLLVTIRHKMFGVALEILGSNEQLATMRNHKGTALHLLARQPFCQNRWQQDNGVMRADMRLLAKKLLAGIQRLGQTSVINEVMKNPPILHDAAEQGNVELITMLTHAYPHLVWHANSKGYTIFHIAANYRDYLLFELINEIGATKNLIAISQDVDGNNILHLAAKLPPAGTRYILAMAVFHMEREMLWFEQVKAIVPPMCWEMLNKDGHTPIKLFSESHKSNLEFSRTWLRNTSDSCLLISTLIFTVVFASAFAVPGGYDQATGIPVLFKANWLTCFVIFEALAMLSSALCIVCFLRIMMLEVRGYILLKHLTRWFVWGIHGLSFSMVGAVSAFMSAYFMIYASENPALVKSVILSVYCMIVLVVCLQIRIFHLNLPQRFLGRKRTRHTLFKRPDVKNY